MIDEKKNVTIGSLGFGIAYLLFWILGKSIFLVLSQVCKYSR